MATRKTFMLNGEQVVLISLDKAEELGIEIIKADCTLAAVRASDAPENVKTFEPEIGGNDGEEIDYDYACSEDGIWCHGFFTTAYIRSCKVYYEYSLDDSYERPHHGTELHSLLSVIGRKTEEKDIRGLDEAKEDYNSELATACREADAEYDACMDFDKAFEYLVGSTFEDWKEEAKEELKEEIILLLQDEGFVREVIYCGLKEKYYDSLTPREIKDIVDSTFIFEKGDDGRLKIKIRGTE